jgi:hypothetical protein
MKRSKFTDEQFLAIVKEGEGGAQGRRRLPHARDHRADVLPLESEVRGSGAQRAATAEAGRRREPHRKHIVAEQTLDIRALKAGVAKKW